MKSIFDKIKIFVLNNYYTIVSILFFLLIGYDYLKYGLNKYMFIFIIFEIYNILKIFNFKVFEKKIFNILPKNKFIYLIFLICLYSGVNTYRANAGISVYSSKPGTDISEAIMVDEIKQDIPNTYDYFDTVSIQFATYARENDAHYKFLLFENDTLIREITFNTKKLEDGKYKKFIFDGVNVDHNKKYSFSIKPLFATSNDCISIFKDNNTNVLNYQLSINKKIDWFKLIITTFLVLVFFIINYFINTRNISVARMYVIFSIYLISMLFLIPANNVPDEWSHFGRAYKVSQMYQHIGDNNYFLDTYHYGPSEDCLFYGNPESLLGVTNRYDILACISSKDNTYHESISFNNLYSANPLIHIVQAIGIFIVDIFSNSPLLIFYAGRITNCIIAFLVVLYAIKNTNRNKILLLFIATLPMFAQQMISYSYDALINAFALLFIYFDIKTLNNEKFSKLDYILLLISIFYMMSVKIIYLPILAPMLYSFNRKDVKNFFKKTYPLFIVFGIAFLLTRIWPLISSGFSVDSNLFIISNENSNLNYLKSNPLVIFRIGINTLSTNGIFYIESLIGYFGWFVYKFDSYIYVVYLLFVFLLLMNKNTVTYQFKVRQKIINFLIILAIVACVFGGMYLIWSSYMLDYVDGVQGRYFIPVIGLFLLSVIPKKQFDIGFDEKDVYVFINIIFLLTLMITLANVY